ncbi:MAG: YihY/virulence factor BrkB family protein [Thiohalocapsa sp.]
MGSTRQISTAPGRLLWQTDPATLPRWQRPLLLPGRMVYAIGRDLTQGFLSLQAMSLVYTTLLSLVPLLAVSFSVLKGFGVHNQLEPMLQQALAPLGDKSHEITTQLIGYVDNINVGVLGSVGLVLLLYSVISLISKIEQVFNYTWHVDRPRALLQRFSHYLSVLLIGPVLFFAAVGATASMRSSLLFQRAIEFEPLGFLLESVGRLVPFVLITIAFTFVYAFVPNTRVKLRSALIGALVAGLLWQGIGQLFATFMSGSTKYAAIYAGLAILILFMIWLYTAWLILLIGANIAFYNQYPEYLGSRARDLRLSNRLRERLGLVIAARVVTAHFSKDPPWTADGLAHAVGMPFTNVRNLLRILEGADVLVRTADEPARYVPARAPEEIPLRDLLAFIRRYGDDEVGAQQPLATASVDALEQRIDDALDATLSGLSLRDLAIPSSEAAPATTH